MLIFQITIGFFPCYLFSCINEQKPFRLLQEVFFARQMTIHASIGELKNKFFSDAYDTFLRDQL